MISTKFLAISLITSTLCATGFAAFGAPDSGRTAATSAPAAPLAKAKAPDSALAVKADTPEVQPFWVKRVSRKVCPIGTTAYVASDGGVQCWAGPD